MFRIKKSNLTLLAVPVLMSSMVANAATNTYDVALPKDYSSAKIVVDVPDDKEFKVTFSDADLKHSYEGTYEDGDIVCIVNELLKAGDWKVTVTDGTYDEDGKFTPAEGNDTSFFENVHVTFEGNIEKKADVGKEITVSADISGLTYYFVDHLIHIEWNAAFDKGVYVEVINKQNNQIIGKDTVMNNSFNCPFTDEKDFIIKVIPYESINVEGAGTQFELHYEENEDMNVAFEDVKVTNKDEIQVSCDLDEGSYIEVYRNDSLSYKTTPVDSKGTYEYGLPIEAGSNTLKVYIVDKDHNMTSFVNSYEKDVVAPVLKLESDYNGTITTDGAITISGYAEDYDYLTCNDNPIEVNGENKFSFDYELSDGVNSITLKASDIAGNSVVYAGTVEKVIEEEPKTNYKIIFVFLVLVVILGVYYRNSKHKSLSLPFFKKNKDESEEIEEKSERKMPRITFAFDKKAFIRDFIDIFVPVIVVGILLTQVICITVAESGSMEPSIMTGDTVFFNRLYYKVGHEVERGDIICFKREGMVLGKRVIGLPGDTIEFRDGYVVINGVYADESAYLDEEVETNSLKVFTVPEDSYFVLGDNRRVSYDSRWWPEPYISKDDIIGKYMGKMGFSIDKDILHKFD